MQRKHEPALQGEGMSVRTTQASEKSVKSKIEFIIIACCTYKRPEQLKRLLNSLFEMNYPKEIRTEILIVDNDKNKSAQTVVKNLKSGSNLHYTTEPEMGLSNARNKALTTAIEIGATHLAFIDDDEIADINWLLNHIDFYNKFEDIYISSGPTYKKFNGDYPEYIINNKTFKTVSSKKLGEYKKTCASGNVFFPLNIIKDNNIYFSKEFNYCGSEDTDFFSRLQKQGYNIGWNFNAVNYEIVDDKRANMKWILDRAYHNGCSVSVSRFTENKNQLKRFLYVTEKFFTVLFNIVITIFSIFFGLTCFFNNLTLIYKNTGKLVGAITGNINSYYEKGK